MTLRRIYITVNNMDNKTKCLFTMLIFLPILCHGLVIDLRDNFENWTATTRGAGNIYSDDRQAQCYCTSTTVKTYGLPITGNNMCLSEDGSATSYRAQLQYNWGTPANTTKYHKMYVYFPTTFFSTFSANTFIDFYRVQITSGGAIYPYPVWVEVGRTPGSTNILRLHTIDQSKVSRISSSTIIPSENRWYEIEILTPQSNGNNSVVRWWVDGFEQPSTTINLTGLVNWAGIEFGGDNSFAGAVGNSAMYRFYMDDLMICDNYIPTRRRVNTVTTVQ
jgi:hypothetical protein